jgi:hypothetical protein
MLQPRGIGWLGVPYDAPAPLLNAVVQKLDADTELHWARVDRPLEPWVVQCIYKGKPLWARILSSEPLLVKKAVRSGESSVEPLGPYGWRVNITVKEGHDFARMHVYIAADRTFLFYFMSW